MYEIKKDVNKLNEKFSIKKILKYILLLYLIYVLIFSLIIFRFYNYDESLYNRENYILENEDEVAILDGLSSSLEARIYAIESAKTSIDITYYAFHRGDSYDIFLSSLVKQADNGIEVRILLDGLSYYIKPSITRDLYALNYHDNITVGYFKKPNFFKPWTYHKGLHDKIMIIDDNYAIMGGRNIGDKYFLNDELSSNSLDRDVFIKANCQKSVIYDMKDYYEYLWSHKYNNLLNNRLSIIISDKYLNKFRYLDAQLYNEYYDIYNYENFKNKKFYSTEKIYFLTNEISTFNSYPVILNEFGKLAKDSDYIFIQSPYIIINNQMKKYIDLDTNADIEILTNSIEINPNFPGKVGYYNERNNLAKYSNYIYEFNSIDTLHAKTYIFDDIVAIGAFNLDPRSSFISTESMIFIKSEGLQNELEENIDKLKDQSIKFDKDDYNSKDVGIIIKIVSPIFRLIDFLLFIY